MPFKCIIIQSKQNITGTFSNSPRTIESLQYKNTHVISHIKKEISDNDRNMPYRLVTNIGVCIICCAFCLVQTSLLAHKRIKKLKQIPSSTSFRYG